MTVFSAILTTVGAQRLAEAHASGTPLALTKVAAGDGGGDYYTLSAAQTALVNKVWEGNVNRTYIDPSNPTWVVIETAIPIDEGPFWVREAGVFSSADELISIGLYPATYKPVLADGSGKELMLRHYMEVTDVDSVTLAVDPLIVMASRQYVDEIEERLLRRVYFQKNTYPS